MLTCTCQSRRSCCRGCGRAGGAGLKGHRLRGACKARLQAAPRACAHPCLVHSGWHLPGPGLSPSWAAALPSSAASKSSAAQRIAAKPPMRPRGGGNGPAGGGGNSSDCSQPAARTSAVERTRSLPPVRWTGFGRAARGKLQGRQVGRSAQWPTAALPGGAEACPESAERETPRGCTMQPPLHPALRYVTCGPHGPARAAPAIVSAACTPIVLPQWQCFSSSSMHR